MFGISGVFVMTHTQNGQSATILQFPVGGRAGFAARKEQFVPPQQRPVVDIHGWYHEEAIRDAESTKTH